MQQTKQQTMSDWLAAATQLGALEMPAKKGSCSQIAPETTAERLHPDLIVHKLGEAWQASQHRIADGSSDPKQEQQLRLQALLTLMTLQPDGWQQVLKEKLLVPLAAIAWGWAGVTGAEELDPPMKVEEAEALQLEAALMVLEPASMETRLMTELTLGQLLDESAELRPVLIDWLEQSMFTALPIPDADELLWRFLASKAPQRVAFDAAGLVEARRAADPSQQLSSAYKAEAGGFKLDVPLSDDGRPITALTPWRPGSLQELVSIQLWQSWFEARLWLRHHERLQRDQAFQLPVPALPDWRSYGIEEEVSDDDLRRQLWDVFADGRAVWMESAADGYGEEMPRFRQQFMAPVTTDQLASALRICEMQLRHASDNSSFLLLHSWMALQVARLDGLRADQLDWAKAPEDLPVVEAFGSLARDGTFPLLPSHRLEDWRVTEVFRPLLFAITAELVGTDSLVETIPSAVRVWQPNAANVTLRQAVIECVTQGSRRFHLSDEKACWLEHQSFELADFIRLIEDVKRGQLNHQLGAIGSLTETFRVPASGHRIPAWLGKRLSRMKEGSF